MTNKSIMYKQVISDYFKDFGRDLPIKKNALSLCLIYSFGFFIYTCAFGMKYGIERTNKNWLVGIPVLFAITSSSFHRVSLPFMMYLIPYSQKQREEYIQKMLYVKIIAPVILGCLFDLTAFFLNSISYYVVILQMTGILFITYICGILCDSDIYETEKRPVYGKIRSWSSIALVFCYMGSTILFIICVDVISKTEFWIVLSIMVLLLLPITATLHKHWKTIRSNFADYEMTIKRTNVR